MRLASVGGKPSLAGFGLGWGRGHVWEEAFPHGRGDGKVGGWGVVSALARKTLC